MDYLIRKLGVSISVISGGIGNQTSHSASHPENTFEGSAKAKNDLPCEDASGVPSAQLILLTLQLKIRIFELFLVIEYSDYFSGTNFSPFQTKFWVLPFTIRMVRARYFLTTA